MNDCDNETCCPVASFLQLKLRVFGVLFLSNDLYTLSFDLYILCKVILKRPRTKTTSTNSEEFLVIYYTRLNSR